MSTSPADPHCTIVTTALSAGEATLARGRRVADALGAQFAERGKTGLSKLMAHYRAERCVVVEHGGLALVSSTGTLYRYHPNLGFVRALNVLRGGRDLFVEAAAIRAGDRVLDCTAGFGSESLLASLAAGPAGKVVALESRPELALVTSEGMASARLSREDLSLALRRIEVVCADYSTYLDLVAAGSYEVVCFDPFFAERLAGSEINVGALHEFGDKRPLDCDAVVRAIAVASRRVVVKYPAGAELPSRLSGLARRQIGAKGRKIVYSVFGREIE